MEAVELIVNKTMERRLDNFVPKHVPSVWSSVWSFISSLFFMQSWVHFIVFALFVTACVEMSFYIFAIVYSHFRFYPKHVSSYEIQREKKLPAVSIIKPLVGVDRNLFENLTSFFTLDYPQYELLFCVATERDPACKLVYNLMEAYPDVEARLFTPAVSIGVNNKINNMHRAYNEAKYKFILISDSSIFMRKDTLLDMVLTMLSEPGVGIVHQSPYILPTPISHSASLTSEERFTRLLQRVYFGTWHSKMYMASASLRFNCTTGMSCMLRKSVMDLAGGLSTFSNYLAEDFFIAKHYYSLGWKCLVSGQPAWQNPSPSTLKSYHARLIRWSQLRAAMVPQASLFEPFTECFPNAILMVSTASFLFPTFLHPILFFIGHVAIWFLLDLLLLSKVHPSEEPWDFTLLEYSTAWLYRESTSIYNQFLGHFKSTIEWHGKHYYLKWGGSVESITTIQPKNHPGDFSTDSL